ncbi:NupC/NupG family nucleoside CNT transporter [bacterium]|nr:NupC/NupG family nucleoside CNT transporter [bacterium]
MDQAVLARVVPFFGIMLLIAVSLAMSSNWRLALKRWPLIAWGFGLQFIFAAIILKVEIAQVIFTKFNDAFVAVINCSNAGAEFVFGPAAPGGYGPGDFATVEFVQKSVEAGLDTSKPAPTNGFFSIAFMVLPTIIFFSALTSILYHLNILQQIVKGIAIVMQKTLGTSGAETLSAAANIFVGQTEAPLIVKPYLPRMTKSELMTVMVGGFATVAGGVMAAYVTMLSAKLPSIAGHLLAASIMSAPAALVFGKLMQPEEENPETGKTLHVAFEKESVNVLDAAALGTSDGLKLALNVGAMLIAFLALIALLDLMLGGIGSLFFGEDVPAWFTLRGIVGYIFAIPAWFLGVTDWTEAVKVGQLLGVKMVANEFVAYLDLSTMMNGDSPISERSAIIASYALCGFANLGSIGIQIGGLSAIAPSRRQDLSRLAFRAMLAGTFAANATGCVAAVLLPV